jgi:hypothetical protein
MFIHKPVAALEQPAPGARTKARAFLVTARKRLAQPGCLAALLALSAVAGVCRGAEVIYPAPAECKRAADFQVWVNGHEVFVYESAVAPFVQFSFSGRAEVKVALKPGVTFPADLAYAAWGKTIRPTPFSPPIKELDVRPKRLGLQPAIAGNELTFALDAPANLSVEINRNLSRPLLVFACPLEAHPPQPGDPHVRYFAPGKVYDVGRLALQNNETIYIAGGAVVRGAILADGVSEARVMGRGILDGSDDQKVPWALVETRNARKILVEGIVILNDRSWTVIPRHSEDIQFLNIKMIAWNNNSDGIDVVGSKRVRIANSFLRNNDDCLAVKAMGAAPDTDVAGLEVLDTVLWNAAAGNALEIGYELRTKSVRDILLRNCDVIHADGAAMSIHNADMATVSNVRFENIWVEDAPKRLIDIAVGLSIYSADCPQKYNRGNPQRAAVPKELRSPRGAWLHLPDDDLQARQQQRGNIEGVWFTNIRVLDNAPASVRQFIGYDASHGVRDVTIQGLWIGGQQILSAEAGKFYSEFARDIRFLPGP